MKTIIFYQSENEISFNLESNQKETINTLVGNFYKRVDLFKRSNAKFFNFSQPILLRIENETINFVDSSIKTETVLNTGVSFKALQMKCKLQWNKKGRNRFKTNVSVCIDAVNMTVETFTNEDYEKLNDSLKQLKDSF